MDNALAIKIEIRPKEQMINVNLVMNLNADEKRPAFYLSKYVVIDSCSVDGECAEFRHDTDQGKLESVDGYPFFLKCSGEFVLMYHGKIEKKIMHSNMISEEYVEISELSALYPVSISDDQIKSVRLEIDIDSEYEVITNCDCIEKKSRQKTNAYTYRSIDIRPELLVIASKKAWKIKNRTGVRAYCFSRKRKPEAYKRIRQCVKIIKLYGKIFGHLHVLSDLRYVMVPRNGFGYAASPCIISCEANVKKSEMVDDRVDYILAHELSHGYWRLVGDFHNDGWVDEGFAEYSVLAYFAHIYDEKRFKEMFAKKYLDKVRRETARESILCTNMHSKNRLLNWYVKPAILFYSAGKKYGFAAINNFAYALYLKYRKTKALSTEGFFTEAQSCLPVKAYRYVKHYLSKNEWDADDVNELASVAGIW